MNNSARRTGRTTRMLKKALKHACEVGPVTIVAANFNHMADLKNMARDMLEYDVKDWLNFTVVRNSQDVIYMSRNLRFRDCSNHSVYYDHYTADVIFEEYNRRIAELTRERDAVHSMMVQGSE